MIKVNVRRDKEKRILSFTCKGHAGYSRHPDEKDMVCAGVSAILYSALGYMEEYYGMKEFQEDDGFIEWNCPKGLSAEIEHKITPVLDAMAVGLKQIELQYGKYIKIVDEEV